MDNLKKLLNAYESVRTKKISECSHNCFLHTDNLLIQNTLLKSLIIAIYAEWESFVKNSAIDFYRTNSAHLYNDNFIKKYFEAAINNSYTRNKLLESISINESKTIKLEIEKDILCASNNLTIKEFVNILNRLEIDTDKFKNHINENNSFCFQKLRTLLKQLIAEGLDIEKTKASESLEEFFSILVEARNGISHTFICETSFNSKQLKIFIEIIAVIKEITSRCLNFKQTILEFSSNQKDFSRIKFVKLIRSNRGAGINTAILHINSEDNNIKKDDLIIIKKENNVFPCKILTIKDARSKNINITEAKQDYTFEIDTDLSIRKAANLDIYYKKL